MGQPIGLPPVTYWQPILGNAYVGPGLRPSDIEDLTPAQLFSAFQSTEQD